MSHSVWQQLIPDIRTRAANQVDKHDERCSDGNPEACNLFAAASRCRAARRGVAFSIFAACWGVEAVGLT
jgi:hypothetical protein